tara:strand:- start:787 stop:2970 length:2184 start_codon:yes stop_codon:yes gene_type:complete
MRPLFYIFLFFSLAQSQRNDIYSRPFQSDPEFDIDVQHYDIDLKILDHEKSFIGKTSITFNVIKPYLENIQFDVETFNVTKVKSEGKELSFEQKNGSLIIQPDEPIRIGDELTYTISYQSDGNIADPSKYGMRGAKVLGLGFFDESDDNPALVQTHSFPEGARHWFPSNDHPADKATSKITTTVRSDWKVLANGVLTESETNWKVLPNGMKIKSEDSGDSTKYVWELNLPNSTYLFVMVAGPFKVIKDYHGDIPMSYWVYPKDVDNADLSFNRTPEIMEFFENEYGVKYPWPKMDQITIPGIGGGAESTTATILGDITIHDQKADKDFPSHWLVAHEAAHQWWGDYITMGNWHHAWLNESFATYGEYLYSSFLYGEDERQINLWKKKQAYFREYNNKYSRPMVHPYWKYPNQNFDSHIYPRGAVVLHMLRQIIGDKNFKNYQKNFLNDFRFGNPKTSHLIRAVNEATSSDYNWFFDQWVLSAGHPQVQIETQWNNGEYSVFINQTQAGRQTPYVYEIPTEIAFHYKNRSEKKSIYLDDRKNVYKFNLKEEPIFIRLDPNYDLLIEIDQQFSLEALLLQLKRENVIGRMEAANDLAEYVRNPQVMKRLKRIGIYDKSWFVRQASLSSLSNVLTFKEWLVAYQGEKDSQPRKTIITQISNEYPEKAADFLRQNLDSDNSYVVQAEMIKQLGIVGDISDIDLIEGYTKIWSPRKIVNRSAKEAVSLLKEN